MCCLCEKSRSIPKSLKMNNVSGSNPLPCKETLCNTSGIERGFHEFSWLASLPVLPLEQSEQPAVLPMLPACLPAASQAAPNTPHQQNVESAPLWIRHNIPSALSMILPWLVPPCVNTVQSNEDHFGKSHP